MEKASVVNTNAPIEGKRRLSPKFMFGTYLQEAGSNSSAEGAAAPDPDAEETGSVDEESLALEHDYETSVGSQDEDAAALEHDGEEASTAPGSGLMMSGGPALHGSV